jgi:hypothetical protein
MEKVRVIHAPPQEGVRAVVLGAVLWPDSVEIHAVVEADAKEIAEPYWEGDQYISFDLTDDLGTEYDCRGAGSTGDTMLHVRDWSIPFRPGVPRGAKTLTVTHLAGSVDLAL